MSLIKVLIVEDEIIIAKDINYTLIKNGFKDNTIITNGEQTLKSVEKNRPDIILMDITLKQNKSGIEIIKELYKKLYIPVIYLTGLSEQEVLSEAIKTNPVGYIVKPFNPKTLLCTISVSLNKIEKLQYKQLGRGYSFDIIHNNLFLDGNFVKLGKKEQLFLSLLVNSNGNSVSFDEIENYIWEEKPFSNDVLRNLVSRLKKKIDPNLIQNDYGYGFKLDFLNT
jgi:DNA-binding response OmpR family regulator